MKVMLINIENEWGGVPLGLVYVAGYLRKEVNDVIIKRRIIVLQIILLTSRKMLALMKQ